MGLLSFIFGAKKREVQRFLDNDAVILDVRTDKEYQTNHIEGSKHIPIDQLQHHVEELKAAKTSYIVCCESGVRSAKAAKFLNLNNIKATNGGGWLKLSKQL